MEDEPSPGGRTLPGGGRGIPPALASLVEPDLEPLGLGSPGGTV